LEGKLVNISTWVQWPTRMTRGGHGLSEVSPGPAMPDPSKPCGRATPETTLQLFQVWPAGQAGGLWPSSTPLDAVRPCSSILWQGKIVSGIRWFATGGRLPSSFGLLARRETATDRMPTNPFSEIKSVGKNRKVSFLFPRVERSLGSFLCT
jgi:hypothetical protein